MSLVIPAHNEEERLPGTLRRYGRAFRDRYGDVEIIVVANGSSDGTADVVRSLADEEPGLRLLDIPEPIHKGGAILRGFRTARGEATVFADADGATDPASLVSLVDGLGDAEVVIGDRHATGSVIRRPQPLKRRILSRAFNLAVRTLFGLRFRDTQCGAKAFRTSAARAIAARVVEREWAFDLDLILVARRLGMRVRDRPVTWSDVDGSQLRAGSAAPGILRSLVRLWGRERAARRRPHGPETSAVRPVGRGRRAHPPREPRRILALNWRDLRHPDAGGAELNLFEQARRWVRDGHDVTVLAAQKAGNVRLPEHDVIDGVRVQRMGGRFSIYLRAAWYLLTRGHHFDRILDVANGIPFFAPLFTARPTALLVHHVHSAQWFTEFPPPLAVLGWLLERFVVPIVYRSRPTIAVSPTTREALCDAGFSDEQVHVVYNGVTAGPVPEVAQRPGLVVYVGRIKRYKRLDLLIRAFARVRRDVPDAHLVIAGDGDARPELEALTDRLQLTDAVRFTGFVGERTKARLLTAAAVFATPSMNEGWGLSVVEANYHGTPAVAYDVPGLRSAIRHDETGLLAQDDAEFREAITGILVDDRLRTRLADGARAWAQRFDWDTAARETLALLEPQPRPSVGARSMVG